MGQTLTRVSKAYLTAFPKACKHWSAATGKVHCSEHDMESTLVYPPYKMTSQEDHSSTGQTCRDDAWN